MISRRRLTRLVGLICILASGTAFTVWGALLVHRSPIAMSDLYPVYYHARILIEHQDPYVEKAAPYIRLRSEGFLDSRNIAVYGMPVIPDVYPPSSLIVVAPLALLRWGPAHVIWMALISICLTSSAILIWFASSEHAPLIAGGLICFLLINSETVLFEGNSAGIAAGLCTIAAWCFVNRRNPLLGVVCLAVSLALKPHDAALVWLCFLLSGGFYRKRALQTLIPITLLIIVAVAWVSSVSPHWPQELKSNIESISVRGGVNDPGPGSDTNLIVNSAINAQTIFAVFRDEPRFYNTASFLLCGILLLPWLIMTLRRPATTPRIWISLAFVSAVSMLPVYHRHHDAKLLLLAVPACAIISAKRQIVGIMSIFFTLLAFTFSADIPRAILTNLEANLTFSNATLAGKVAMLFLARPAPLAILAMAIFYLWAYWQVDLDVTQSTTLRSSDRDLAVGQTS